MYGAGTFRSRRKLREIIDAYREKAGASFNLHRFDAEEDDFAQLSAIAGGQSLFASKKLIVIERPFVSARQFGYVRDALKDLRGDNETLAVLWDGVIAGDAKKMLAEIEPLIEKVQTFEPLRGDKLMRWLKQEVSVRGFDFSPAEFAHLATMGGDDLWMLYNEMEKVAVMSTRHEIQNTRREKGATVFQLGDAFFINPKAALGYLLSLLAAGEDEMRVFSYLAGYARTLLLVKAYFDLGRPVSGAHKIHPFVVKKASAAVQAFSQNQLVRRLTLFLEEDVKIKTGLARPEESLVHMLIRAPENRVAN